jgi:hypothetical protein
MLAFSRGKLEYKIQLRDRTFKRREAFVSSLCQAEILLFDITESQDFVFDCLKLSSIRDRGKPIATLQKDYNGQQNVAFFVP